MNFASKDLSPHETNYYNRRTPTSFENQLRIIQQTHQLMDIDRNYSCLIIKLLSLIEFQQYNFIL